MKSEADESDQNQSAHNPAQPLLHAAFLRLLAVQAAFGMSFSIFLILPKHMTVNLHAGPFEIGWVTALYGLANIAVSRPLSRLLSWVGRKRVLQLGALCAAAGGSVFMFIDHVGPLAGLGRILQGVSWAMIFAAGSSLAADLAPPGRMAQAMAVFASAVLAMNAVGPPLAEPMLNLWGPMPVFGVAVVSSLLAFFLAKRLPHSDPVPEPDVGPTRALPRPYLALWVLLGLACGTMFTFHQPLALLRGVPRVSDFLLGYTAAALSVRVMAGRLLDKVGYRRACVAALALYAMVVLCTGFMTPGLVVVLGAAFGLAHGTFYPALMALSVAQVGVAERSALMVTINVAFNAGAMMVVVLGYWAETVGLPLVFTLTGVATAFGLWWLRPGAVLAFAPSQPVVAR